MTTGQRLARIRSAERATAERRAALPPVDVQVIELDGRPLLRITRWGALVADVTPEQAQVMLAR